MTETLHQLPNKDLWRGCVIADPATPPTDAEVISDAQQNPLNRIMAQILKASAGARELTCVYCGMQSDEKFMRKHITEQHQKALVPSTAADAAMATVAQQLKANAEATA